jgi:hypothetical protein
MIESLLPASPHPLPSLTPPSRPHPLASKQEHETATFILSYESKWA